MTSWLALLLIVVATALAGAALSVLSLGADSLLGSLKSRLLSSAGSDNTTSESLPDSNGNVRTSTQQALGTATASNSPIEELIAAVNEKLPQTQCAQCGHPGCRPYAQAIVMDDAPINQCPPGGLALIEELAVFLGKPVIALDTERGENKPPQVAFIDEAVCIGCTLCIEACPVDAIVGASRLMHTVVVDQCTGCELCVPPCPVDCIELEAAAVPLSQWQWPKPASETKL